MGKDARVRHTLRGVQFGLPEVLVGSAIAASIIWAEIQSNKEEEGEASEAPDPCLSPTSSSWANAASSGRMPI